MMLSKNGKNFGEISQYLEDTTFSPKKVLFQCRPPINDVEGVFDINSQNGASLKITITNHVSDGVASHIRAREAV
jgi:hypothetical protein